MSKTTSLPFPNMFNVAQNCVDVIEDDVSVVNRSRLLMLSDPTELYHNPDFGVGMKKHLWTYNNDNQKAILYNEIKRQLGLHEPYAVAEETSFADGLLFTGTASEYDPSDYHSQLNQLKFTCSIQTTYDDIAEVKLNDDFS